MTIKKILVIVGFGIAVALYLAFDLGRYLSLDALKAQQSAIAAYQSANPVMAVVIARPL